MTLQLVLVGVGRAVAGRKGGVPIIEGLEKIVVAAEGDRHRLRTLVVADDLGRAGCARRVGLVSVLGRRNTGSHFTQLEL